MKTKRELRQEAIERLKEHINHPGYYRTLIKAIVGDDYDELTVEECDERLIDLLTDDDDDMGDYIKLPKDANGEVIHIGDEVVVNARGRRLTVDGVGRSEYDVIFCADRPGYTAYVAKTCHRYHKPTVDEILDELEGMRGTGDYDAVVERCSYLAGMLRELLKEDE